MNPMSPSERDASKEVERHVRHQSSTSSDLKIRALVPMWDSSDPERAPPPLPLNPQSPSLTSRVGTSSAIQSAHAALSERVRESCPSPTKRTNDPSPERSIVRTSSHRRLLSLQPGNVRDLGSIIEGSNSRPTTPTTSATPNDPRSPTKDFGNGLGPGPTLTPILRPTARRMPTESILGENTPPQSSTMLALQNMPPSNPPKAIEAPLSDITNAQSKSSHTLDGLGSQLQSLTTIALTLQKEIAALSRRSRDNATDLLSLKKATNTRDEDIRKSLRDLVGQVNDQNQRLSVRDTLSTLLIDNKPHNGSTSRTFNRAPTPESDDTPSLDGTDNTATIALLETILNGLGTKDGEASLVKLLSQLSKQVSGMATATKIDELAQFVKSQQSNALVAVSAVERGRALSFDDSTSNASFDVSTRAGPMTQRMERLLNNADNRKSMTASPSRGSELVNEDMISIIRSVKDSVAQGGGMTAEVKALVRELRGEVLGMGRELAKRLENVERAQPELDDVVQRKDDVSRVIDEGLEQMKEQLNHVLKEHRRQSTSSSVSQKTAVDYQEIYNAMRAALRDNEASRDDMPDLSREDVVEAVREAWESYKPEVEAHHPSLERDEIMACLKEGLQDYQPRDEQPEAATREEVFTAVVEGLKHFVPPQVDTAASLSRDEIIEAVRDCLEEFEFPVSAAAIGNDMNKEHMVHAVKEGLRDFDMPRGGLSGEDNEEIMTRLQDIMEYMKLEFRAASEEARDNIAATSRDTEHILDGTKEGLENLRAAIESYVDRAGSVASGGEDMAEQLSQHFDGFKEEIGSLIAGSSESSREQLRTELEGIREMVNTSMVAAVPQASSGSSQELLETLQNGLNSLRQDLLRPRPETGELLDALNDGLNDIRAGIDRITNKPVDLTANDEIIDTIRSGLDSVRSDIETLRDNNERAMTAVAPAEEKNMDTAIIPLDTAKQDDIKNLEVLITQLRIKVEAMEPESEPVQRDDLARLEEMIRDVQNGVHEIGSREQATARDVGGESTSEGDNATRDDVQAIETILRNTKDRLDDLIEGDQAVRKEHLDTLLAMATDHKEAVGAMSERLESTTRKEDIGALEELLAQVIIGIDELKENSAKDEDATEKVTKADVEAIEARVLEIRSALDNLADMDFATVSNKDDIANIETLLRETKEHIETHGETNAKSNEERQLEMLGLNERVTEVKTFLEEFQEAVHTKLDDGSTGVEALGKLLEAMGEKMDKNENVGQDLKEMFDTMKNEFEVSKEIAAGSRIESDEKFQEATDNMAAKIEEKIAALVEKYDEFQANVDEKSKAGEARDLEIESAVMSAKAVSDDLKILIDTLGSTVTESLEKMEEASKTVFEKVEDLSSKSDESRAEGQTEHQLTRDHVTQAVSAVEALQGDIKDFQPQILEAVKDILLLVGEHFEHSKTSVSDIQEKIVEQQPKEQAMLAAPPPKYDDAAVREQLSRLIDQRYDDSEVKEKLDRLEQRYTDTAIHEKLDKLADHSASTTEAFARLATLEKVHDSVMETATQMSDFMSTQTQRIANADEDRERTLHETELALERKLAEKDHAEAAVLSLHEEDERLRTSVMNLRNEQESLIRQKTRLTGDVSSLETALRLRREELAEMEARAERLERRIVEGVMDHSRVLLMGKSNGSRDNMNRKRVKKPIMQESDLAKSSPRPAVSMALSTRRSIVPSAQNGAARRIASLSQMNSSMSQAAVKRSQSVRTPAGNPLRKRSWGGALSKTRIEDKENMAIGETLEEDEESMAASTPRTPLTPGELTRLSDIQSDNYSAIGSSLADDDNEDARSNADTMRRASAGTTIISASDYTESDIGYDYDDATSVWTESAVGERSSYGGAEEDTTVLH